MYSGYCYVNFGFMYGAFTLYGRSFQDRSITFVKSRLQSEPQHARTLVWALTISLAATLVIDFSFSSSGYLDVSVHRVPGLNLWIQLRSTRVFLVRFPHSDICGSMCICHSPQLFAAYHVFHRLLVPRHPPCALIASFLADTLRYPLWSCSDSLLNKCFSFGLFILCYLSITSRMSWLKIFNHLFSIQFSKYNFS